MSYLELEKRADQTPPFPEQLSSDLRRTYRNDSDESHRRMVDVVLSDMLAPWDQTEGFWKRSKSNPYYRMMNTSGINTRDHAGSMVSAYL